MNIERKVWVGGGERKKGRTGGIEIRERAGGRDGKGRAGGIKRRVRTRGKRLNGVVMRN